MGDELVRNRLAAMQVGQEADAQAGQLGRPARDVERRSRHLDVVALVHEPVGAGPRERADAGGGARPCRHVAPAGGHPELV